MSPFREFLATAPLEQVTMLVAQVGRMRHDPLFLKAPYSSRGKDGTYIEIFQSGGDVANLVVWREKSKYDDAKLRLPAKVDELAYVRGQIKKVENEIARGQEGRMNDLEKFDSESVRLNAEVNDLQTIVDNPKVQKYAFKLDECL